MSKTETDTPQDLAAMLSSRRHAWVPLLALALLVLGGLGLYAVGAAPKREARASAADRAARAASSIRRIQVAQVRSADPVAVIRQPSTLEPFRRAQVLAQVGGYLVERRVDVGDRVASGQVLGLIATPVIEKELTEAESSHAVARAELTESTEKLDLANKTLERMDAAARQGAASPQDLDTVQNQARRSAAEVERSKAAVAQAEAQIERLHRMLDFRELRAPFDGVVTRRTREQGDYIEVGGNSNDPPVFTIVDSSTLRCVVRFPQAQAYLIKVDQPAKVKVSGLMNLVIDGRVSHISGEFDQATRTMPVEIEVPNADGRLIAGSFATVEISVTRPPEDLPAIIPGNALMLLPKATDGSLANVGGGGPTVAVLTGDHAPFKLIYRPVTLGRDFGSEVEIIRGVSPGETIALNIPVPLAPDTQVEPVVPETPAK
jgi:RND family efflux transporter MFP subunit